MDLSQAQMDTYQREGFLVFERVFSPPELAVLEAALPDITDPSRPTVGFDEVSSMVRRSHGAHLYNETLRRLSLHPRLVRPAQRLLESDFHVYQSRLTIKPGNSGIAASGWAWHQDFATWHLIDGMPEPRAVVVFTFLDDVTAANAPVLVVPRSHGLGIVGTNPCPGKDGDYDVDIYPDTLHRIAQGVGVTALTGPVGTVVFMNCALVHGSPRNISPLRRALFTVVFNPVNNRPQHPRSREHWVHADAPPVRPLTDDCLLTMASSAAS